MKIVLKVSPFPHHERFCCSSMHVIMEMAARAQVVHVQNPRCAQVFNCTKRCSVSDEEGPKKKKEKKEVSSCHQARWNKLSK